MLRLGRSRQSAGGSGAGLTALLRSCAVSEFAGAKFVVPATIVAALLLFGAVVSSPLELKWQGVFATVTVIAMLTLRSNPSRGACLAMIFLSITVSTRYMWWRFTQTLNFAPTDHAGILGALAPVFGIGLVLAELYAWLVLILGYFQAAWPLERPPVALPDDVNSWPTVDLFITTYNESLAVVQNTVFGALSIDYPPGKLRIYILDDGRREEFHEFARAVQVGYITRRDNIHFKAGNLNNALSITTGELIALFDADHVPTRAFLQLTVGGFMTDPKLAMIQTPHYFYSPDPFERNLETGTTVPNEGQLFYGVVQAGNDLWNAAFFCGSCGVVRRTALAQTGGFATDSVTEDALTALRIHRAGWNSAYLRVPLAAGLATERLALHVGQRMRWARGMTQVFRLDNPLFGRGLSIVQRLCYLNAMLHFLFALPRIIFLLAPLAYLLFQQNIIGASGLMIVAYAGPHILHATVTNSRVYSRYRYSFWGDVYECVLSFYLLWPTLATLINPNKGQFNVTEKGGLLPRDYFDYRIAWANIAVAGLLALALIIAFTRVYYSDVGSLDLGVLALNVAWASFNLATLTAAIAVAHETRQVRSAVRFGLELPAVIHLPNGRTIVTRSKNLSTIGALFAASLPADGPSFGPGEQIHVELPIDTRAVVVPAEIVAWQGEALRVAFAEMTLREQRDLVRIALGRADAWLGWEAHPDDRPLRSVWEIFTDISGLFVRHHGRALAPGLVPAEPVAPAVAPPSPQGAVVGLCVALAVGLGALMMSIPSAAQPARLDTPPSAAATDLPAAGTSSTPAPLTGAAAPPPQGAQLPPGAPPIQLTPGTAAPGQSLTPPNQPTAPAAAGGKPAAATGLHGSTRQLVYTLKDLGAYSPMRLLGVDGEGSLPFSVRRDEVVTGGKISLSFAYSPALIPELSHLTVLLNGEVIGSIPLPKNKASADTAELDINPVFFQEDNRLLFRFIGQYTTGCEDPLNSTLWMVVSNASTLQLQTERLPLRNDLSLLPLPFYDPRDMAALRLPFVFFGRPSLATLQAAGSVASSFGSLASYKGATFPVSFDAIPSTNAIVMALTSDKTGPLPLHADGPTISVVTNPNNPEAKLLLVLGRSPEELRAAARTLALGAAMLSGATQTVGEPDIPARKPYDAPRWLPLDRPVRFGELVRPTDLQGNGLVPGLLTLDFRTAPDLFVWLNQGIPLDIRYRYPAGAWVDFRDSRLDVSINNSYLRSLPLAPETSLQQLRDMVSPDFVVNEQPVYVPPYYIFGQNQLQFYYDLRPEKRGECQETLPTNVQTAIDPDSTIDMSQTQRFTTLPNLAFFANSGYPFTVMADLSDTAIVLPEPPTPPDIEAYLTLMGMMGASTGYPAIRQTVIGSGAIDEVADKDIIVLGAIPAQPLLARWADFANLRVEGNRLRVRVNSPLGRVFTALDPTLQANRERADQVLISHGDDLAALFGMESPLKSGRSVMVITGSRPDNLMTVLNTFQNRDLSPYIQGDLAAVSGGKVTSFRIGNEYTVGRLPFLIKIRWWLGNSPLIFIAIALFGLLLATLLAYRLLGRLASARLGQRRAD